MGDLQPNFCPPFVRFPISAQKRENLCANLWSRSSGREVSSGSLCTAGLVIFVLNWREGYKTPSLISYNCCVKFSEKPRHESLTQAVNSHSERIPIIKRSGKFVPTASPLCRRDAGSSDRFSSEILITESWTFHNPEGPRSLPLCAGTRVLATSVFSKFQGEKLRE